MINIICTSNCRFKGDANYCTLSKIKFINTQKGYKCLNYKRKYLNLPNNLKVGDYIDATITYYNKEDKEERVQIVKVVGRNKKKYYYYGFHYDENGKEYKKLRLAK